jgi:type I restriction enzyme R subunit
MQLTPDNLTALEGLLAASDAGTEADIARAREESHGLGLFIRSLVGLDREAATEAFNRYLSDTTFSSVELRFIEMIVEHLTANGIVEASRLYESPFTDIAPRGPDMIFTEERVDGIVEILDEVRAHALPEITAA